MKFLQIVVLIFCLSVFVNAQSEKSNVTLTGTVYDRVGAVIPNVVIRLKNKNGKIYQTEVDFTKNKLLFYEIKVPAGICDIEFGTNWEKPYKIKSYRITSVREKMILDVAIEYETFKEQKVLY